MVQIASEQHAQKIAEMSREYIEYGLEWGWTERRVLLSMRDPNTNVVVVASENDVHGFGIMLYEHDDAHLELLAVLPNQRRKGIASAIIKWLEVVATACGAAQIHVQCRRTNTAARHLYLEHNFHEKKIDRRAYGGLEDRISLTKHLRSQSFISDQ
jgi:[ribosomal protein S18]-alanine N-acetyltransferase